MKYKVALLVGRFQPFHNGHLYLIKKALENADKLVIGIGTSNITDVNNPLDYEIRKKIIKAVVYKEKLEDKVIKIVPLDDFYNAEKWKKNVESQVGKFDLVVGNNEWTNGILEKAGYKILHCPYFKRYLYEGWRIRKLISEGKNFKSRVPKYLYPSLIFNFQFSIFNQFSKSNFQIKNLKYRHVVLGGTFDHLHVGHLALIKKAFEIGEKVTIGLATEKLYKNKFLSKIIESYKTRKKNLNKLIKVRLKYDRSGVVTPISDIYGTTLENKEFDAIVVSRETLSNAIKINEKRSSFAKTSEDKKKKLKPLQIVVIEDVLADDGKIVSSERIRRGEIDRKGHNFQFPISNFQNRTKKELIMPGNLIEKLREPIGKVYKVLKSIKSLKFMKPPMIIAVGDIISTNLISLGIRPNIMIVDFKSRREPLKDSHELLTDLRRYLRKYATNQRKSIVNNPGTVNLKAVEAIKKAIDKFLCTQRRQTIIIDGEEDLLTLPAILLAPLGSIICYGQWDRGAVIVEVNEQKKEEVTKILSKFQ